MKKIIFILLFILSTITVFAKEQLTQEEYINKKCGTKISEYNNNPTVDNQINATECVIKYLKFQPDLMPLLKDLYCLYSIKYNNSANNPYYFDKMYEYGLLALKNGSKDVALNLAIVYQAAIKKNIKDLDYSFELLSTISPQKASEIKESISQARKMIQEENDLKAQQTIQKITQSLNHISTGTPQYQSNTNYISNKGEKTYITQNNSHGKVLLTPEYVIIIANYDTYLTTLWLPMDNILILEDSVINLSNGEKAQINSIQYK